MNDELHVRNEIVLDADLPVQRDGLTEASEHEHPGASEHVYGVHVGSDSAASGTGADETLSRDLAGEPGIWRSDD